MKTKVYAYNNFFSQFHKFFSDNYLKMFLWGAFQVEENYYAVEMANGYATVWEMEWERTAELCGTMRQAWREFDEDGELIGLIGEGFRGKFVKVSAKIGVGV